MRSIYASDTRIDDRALASMQEMTGLETLHVSHTRITDAGLQRLGTFPELAWLNVGDLPMTDATVPVLLGLKKLRHIEMNRTQLTPAGEARLKAAGIERVNIER
jgi:hypothetical protein